MRKGILWFWIILGVGYAQPRTQPSIQVGATAAWLRGAVLVEAPQPGLALGLGMWRYSRDRWEWHMTLHYHRQPLTVRGYRGQGRLAVAEELNLLQQGLQWHNLAVWHLAKPGFNLQGGAFFGLGLEGSGAEPGTYLDEPGRMPAAALTSGGGFSYGPVIGVGGGTRLVQGYLHYAADLRDYASSARATLRRSWLHLGLTFVVPGVEIF
jgi:hypothetical protein